MGCCATNREEKKEKQEKENEKTQEEDEEFGDKNASRRIAEIYRKYDINNDGSLDHDEFRDLMNNILKDQGRTATDDEINQFIKAADSNNDGKIQKR